MIIFGPGVAETVADSARTSLDREIEQLRAEGRLEAGKKTLEGLRWTPETLEAARGFEKNIDLSPLTALGIDTNNIAKENIKWTGPVVYADVLLDPLKYSSSAAGGGIFGILALDNFQLPEIGDSGSKKIQSGSVAYFRDSDPVVYRSCGGGRGILFYISL
ncbi:hypothetical protein BCON_0735g00020 [Botryotinia convoluta]|uniref:Uncharacterized protein n=1 Tax=Botryotinia convoluta TaxID=54673 RepID=A0A4Z1H8Y8_9HELO|nr:hypothetical protein BCON_0735g00020 [Botryotinia convoluta]